ncbi:MAG: hypothetical protein L7T83_03030 [Ilumatobacteraceae bacterium]|nr:hypothetical protein [Ilumatobacteraceae bacterium]
MADDEIVDHVDEEVEDDINEEEFDADAEDDDGEFEDSNDEKDGDYSDDDDDDDDDSGANSRSESKEDEDDDDDLVNEDDVEADLDTILKDRMVTVEDDEEEEGETPVIVDNSAEAVDGVQPKRSDEKVCPSCFLLVRSGAPTCPVGDDDCPIISG